MPNIYLLQLAEFYFSIFKHHQRLRLKLHLLLQLFFDYVSSSSKDQFVLVCIPYMITLLLTNQQHCSIEGRAMHLAANRKQRRHTSLYWPWRTNPRVLLVSPSNCQIWQLDFIKQKQMSIMCCHNNWDSPKTRHVKVTFRRINSKNTPCPKKTCDYIFYNNFNNKCPITIIFGTVSGKSTCHRKTVSFPTSPI